VKKEYNNRIALEDNSRYTEVKYDSEKELETLAVQKKVCIIWRILFILIKNG
jgi:hypothetical protein